MKIMSLARTLLLTIINAYHESDNCLLIVIAVVAFSLVWIVKDDNDDNQRIYTARDNSGQLNSGMLGSIKTEKKLRIWEPH